MELFEQIEALCKEYSATLRTPVFMGPKSTPDNVHVVIVDMTEPDAMKWPAFYARSVQEFKEIAAKHPTLNNWNQ